MSEPIGQSEPPTTPPPTTVRSSRAGRTWTGLVVGSVALILLLVFILQNTESVGVSFLWWTFSLPLGVLVLFAAIVAALVMAIVGGIRMLELRHAARSSDAAHE